MKEFDTDMPNDILARHKLVAYTAMLAIKDFLSPRPTAEVQVVVHSAGKNANSLIKELQSLGLNVVAFCDGLTCRWNEKGLDLDNGADSELDINPSDTYRFDSEVFIFDDVREYLDEEDSRDVRCKIIIETGNYVTAKAKRTLLHKGVQVIPHQFFALNPLENAEPKNLKNYSERYQENWKSVANYAKKENTSFEFAFDYLISQRMV